MGHMDRLPRRTVDGVRSQLLSRSHAHALINATRRDRHLHLHVISADLTAPALKTKRHYNSFSPRTGFFVPLTEVRAWFNDDGAKVRKNCKSRKNCSHVVLLVDQIDLACLVRLL
jgi:hypothetical protein